MKTNLSLSALVVCAMSLTCFAQVRAEAPDEPAAVVKKLYEANKAKKPLFHQTDSRAALDSYFRKDLADLIWKDAVAAKGEIGALDFDPLYGSQDPQITEFETGGTGWGGDKKFGGEDDAVVQVTFKDSGKKVMVSYQFDRDKTSKIWKISDVRYPDDLYLAKILKGGGGQAADVPAEGDGTVKYQPGDAQAAKVWELFYQNPGAEEDLMTPLVKAGPKMVPVILQAIFHKDMRLRRYAIGALGNLNDTSALEPLTAIVNDTKEEDYFRGDALSSIYKLDQGLGTKLAEKFASEGDNLKMICTAILKKEPWLLAGLSPEPAAGGTCDAEAYVIDKDPAGLNVRSEPRIGSVIGNLPHIARPHGLIVHIIGESAEGGWLQIDRGETTGGETPYAGPGWVSGNMLAVSTKSSDKTPVKLYSTESVESKVAATLPHGTEVTLVGCRGKMLRVKFKEIVGWLPPESQCVNVSGKCD